MMSRMFSEITNSRSRYALAMSPRELMLSNLRPLKDREKKVSKFEQSGLTEEELLRQQEELFAASRAKFESGAQQ